MRILPVAEAFWKIPPRNAGTVAMKHGLDKQAVVDSRSTNMGASQKTEKIVR